MKRGRLIVIEGTDGSGKSTQFARLCRRAEHEGIAFQRLVFPSIRRSPPPCCGCISTESLGESPAM